MLAKIEKIVRNFHHSSDIWQISASATELTALFSPSFAVLFDNYQISTEPREENSAV